jgi:hypothetical protein
MITGGLFGDLAPALYITPFLSALSFTLSFEHLHVFPAASLLVWVGHHAFTGVHHTPFGVVASTGATLSLWGMIHMRSFLC